METLLSHSFDYLSSASPQKIRKGLRQVEGLLAQICMSKTTNPANKQHSMLALGSTPPPSSPKKLTDLHQDPAYREFFKLQQSFQWNVCMRLISCLERLLGKESNGTNDLLVIQTLELIQGVLLLHLPSRELFAREIYMNVCRPNSLPSHHTDIHASSSSISLTHRTVQPSSRPLSSHWLHPFWIIPLTHAHSRPSMAC